jgi:hypothetical protein
MDSVVEERRVEICGRMCNEEWVGFLALRWGRWLVEEEANELVGVSNVMFKCRTQIGTNSATLSSKLEALGYLRWDRRKNASTKAVKGNPRMQKSTNRWDMIEGLPVKVVRTTNCCHFLSIWK